MKRRRIEAIFFVLLAVLLAGCAAATNTAVPATVQAVDATATVEVTTAAAPTATAAVDPTALPTPSPTPVTLVTIEPAKGEPYAVVGVAAGEVVQVRAQAGAGQAVVGTIPFDGSGVVVTGPAIESGGSSWLPVRYEQVTGWAEAAHLAAQVGTPEPGVAKRAAEIVLAMHDRDLERLASYVHPDKGVRFSPYGYVRGDQAPPADRDLTFSAGELPSLGQDPTVYHWGVFDGSGAPIEMTFADYWLRFVYDADFAYPDEVGYGVPIGQGNTINNVADVYPASTTVEYHFRGFQPDLMGMDWRSLRLVLEPYQGGWVLVAVVHAEWTI